MRWYGLSPEEEPDEAEAESFAPLDASRSQAQARPATWTAADAVKGVVAAVGLIVVVLIATVVLVEATDASDSVVALATTVVLDVLLVGVALRFTIWKYRLPWTALGFRRLGLEQARWALPAGIFTSLAVAVVYAAIVNALGIDQEVRSTSELDELGPGMLAALVFMIVVGAPVAEELFFRGFLYTGLRQRLGFKGAAIVASAIFAAAHIHPLTYLPIFVIGIILTWVYSQTGSLAAPMLVHAAYNGVIVALFFAFV